MYKIERNSIWIQVIAASVLIVFGITLLQGFVMKGIACVFGILLYKDAVVMYVSEYILDEQSIKLIIGKKVKWEIFWGELDMMTRTKKNPKWIVLSDKKEFYMIKHSTENFQELARMILLYGIHNQDLKIHESMSQYLDFELELDNQGRLKSESRKVLKKLRKNE